MNDCFFFKKKTYDKRKFIMENKLCFGCLSKDCMSKTCKHRLVCKICHKPHPTCLHRDNGAYRGRSGDSSVVPADVITGHEATTEPPVVAGPEARAFTVSRREQAKGRVLSPSIPVRIRLVDENVFIETYMALDSWASDCFLSQSLLHQLHGSGINTSLLLTTMGQASQRVSAIMVDNLEISCLNGDGKIRFNNAFALKNWPFNKDDVPRKSDVECFDHLHSVLFEFIDCEIGILIGA